MFKHENWIKQNKFDLPINLIKSTKGGERKIT